MGEVWRVLGRQISLEEQERAKAGQKIPPFHPTPGLLISLGDGRAVEVTEEMLAKWHAWAAGATLVGENDRRIARGIIQQAQEKR